MPLQSIYCNFIIMNRLHALPVVSMYVKNTTLLLKRHLLAYFREKLFYSLNDKYTILSDFCLNSFTSEVVERLQISDWDRLTLLNIIYTGGHKLRATLFSKKK